MGACANSVDLLINRELYQLYDAADDNETQEIFSDGDLEEYWENIKRNAIAEVNIMVAKEENENADKPQDQADLIKEFIADKVKPNVTNHKDGTKNLNNLGIPKNETEKLLYRKLEELNDARTTINKLEIKLQKE